MKLAITAILSLIAGGLIGAYLAFGAGMNVGGVGGFVAGAQGGACLALESAREKGLIPAGQIDGVIAAAIGKIKAQAQIPAEKQPKWVASEADCSMMLADMRRAAGR
jgi:hypothetical protein